VKMKLSLCAALLCLSGAVAAPPQIEIQPEQKPVDGWVRVVPKTDAVSVVYISLDGLSPFPSEELKDVRRLIVPVHNAKAGKYRFVAVAASKEGDQVRVDFVVTVGTQPPAPPPPQPPQPPQPPKVDLPIAGDGLKVLVVFDEQNQSKLTAGQQAILYGAEMRNYLNSKCVAGPDGKTKEFRIWDKDVDATSESKQWQDAFKRKRNELPWLVISNGKTGFEGPLPKTVSEAVELIKKYEVK